MPPASAIANTGLNIAFTSNKQCPHPSHGQSPPRPTKSTAGHRVAAGLTPSVSSTPTFNADVRRIEVERLSGQYGFARGAKASITKQLEVHPSTVTRDVQRVRNPDDHPVRLPTGWSPFTTFRAGFSIRVGESDHGYKHCVHEPGRPGEYVCLGPLVICETESAYDGKQDDV
jgi:hypothetical protein